MKQHNRQFHKRKASCKEFENFTSDRLLFIRGQREREIRAIEGETRMGGQRVKVQRPLETIRRLTDYSNERNAVKGEDERNNK